MSFLDRLKGNRLFGHKPDRSPAPAAADRASAASIASGEDASAPQEKETRVAQLTPREHDLFLLLLEGYTLKECAAHLGVKYSTANTHMTGVYRKLGVRSRAELIIGYRCVI